MKDPSRNAAPSTYDSTAGATAHGDAADGGAAFAVGNAVRSTADGGDAYGAAGCSNGDVSTGYATAYSGSPTADPAGRNAACAVGNNDPVGNNGSTGASGDAACPGNTRLLGIMPLQLIQIIPFKLVFMVMLLLKLLRVMLYAP
jgi:hypothetical protein